jgi:dGTPase
MGVFNMSEELFHDLYSGDKIISNLNSYKTDFLNRINHGCDEIELVAILHQFSHLLNHLIDVSSIIGKQVYNDLISPLKNHLNDFINSDQKYKIYKEVIEEFIGELNENVTAPRNIKNVLTKNKDIITKLSSKNPIPKYNIFISDYDRIVSSSGIRRMQDKTQVYPLEKYDFVRTRLTHSHEVASISELIIDLLYKYQLTKIGATDNQLEEKIRTFEIYDNLKLILRSASLIHDIGNPPFGHYGEDVIKNYFTEFLNSNHEFKLGNTSGCMYKIKDLPIKMKNDFMCFDGNAQGLRVITKLQQYKSSPLNLSSAILGSIIKYPYNSTNTIKKNKYGYFYSEEETIRLLKAKGVYVDEYVNPLAFILEACDDIANFVSDFEDAIKKGIINYEIVYHIISEINDSDDIEIKKLKSSFENLYKMNIIYGNQFEKTMNQIISGLKKIIIQEVALQFNQLIEKFEDIGNIEIKTSDDSLIDRTKFSKLIKYIQDKSIKKYVYTNKSIIKSEIKGYNIINTLLDVFTKAILEMKLNIRENKVEIEEVKSESNYKKYAKLFNMISTNFIDVYINEIQNNEESIHNEVYFRLRLVVDFLSGMTDTYIEDFYNEIFA